MPKVIDTDDDLRSAVAAAELCLQRALLSGANKEEADAAGFPLGGLPYDSGKDLVPWFDEHGAEFDLTGRPSSQEQGRMFGLCQGTKENACPLYAREVENGEAAPGVDAVRDAPCPVAVVGSAGLHGRRSELSVALAWSQEPGPPHVSTYQTTIAAFADPTPHVRCSAFLTPTSAG